MQFNHRFRVRAPLERVVDFHRRSRSMAAITPPPILVRMGEAPETLADDDRMDFTMWLGPLPIRWQAQITDVHPHGFTDRQLEGPFDRWEHRHLFVPAGPDQTDVVDEVSVRLHDSNRFWQLVGFGMWLGLPLLFAFRAWRTRHLLEGA